MKNELLLTHWCLIRNNQVVTDDKVENVTEIFSTFAGFLKALYKKEQISYPKFYKMDSLSKLGFLTSEKVLKESHVLDHYRNEEIGIIIFNSSASLETDIEYQKTIQDKSNYFPSPSVFVYTLPNIVIGEICIRHQIKGENVFFITEKFDAGLILNNVACLMESGRIKACLCGWIDVLEDNYESVLFVIENGSSVAVDEDQAAKGSKLTGRTLNNIYYNNGE